MSENNVTPEELVESINYSIEDANVIPTPVDPTLSIQGMAAEAYATGQRFETVLQKAFINGLSFDSNNSVTLYADRIQVTSEQDSPTIRTVLETLGGRTASDIIFDPVELTTVKEAVDAINTEIDADISETEIDEIIDDVFGEV